MKKLRRAALRCFLFFFLTLLTRNALAHAIAVWAEVIDDDVRVEAIWSDGKPVVNARIEVRGPERKLLVTGRTNEKGKFTFAPPVRADLAIRVVAGGDHEGTATIKAVDLERRKVPPKPSP